MKRFAFKMAAVASITLSIGKKTYEWLASDPKVLDRSEEQGGGSGCSTSTVSDPGPQKRPTWVEYYRNMAFCVSMRSKDPVQQVGCVIVDRNTLRVLSVGYNGFPPGIENEGKNWQKEEKSDLVVHAEANAVLLAGQADLEDSIAFVTMFPCLECAKMLIAKGVTRVYYLSLKKKYYQESNDIFEAAGVEILSLKRGEDTTLKEFKVDLINRLENAIKQIQKHLSVEPNEAYQELQTTIDDIGRDDHEDTPPLKKFKAYVIERLQNVLKQMPIEVNGTYQDLWKITENRRRKDLESPWPRQFKKDEILLNSWPDYFLFLALMASTRGLENPQGVTLIDSTTFKVSALAYNGYPRGVSSDIQNDSMQVSALINAICLRSSEGHDFYAFSTHFPSLQDAKNLAQAKIKRLYFICPKSLEGNEKRALEILQKAGMEVVPMDVPDLAKLKQGIEKTIKGLQEAEKKNPEFPFSDWPSDPLLDYELRTKKPKKVSQSGNAQ